MQKHYTVTFLCSSDEGDPAFAGTKQELIAELQNLIDTIDSMDDDDDDYSKQVLLNDFSGLESVIACIDPT